MKKVISVISLVSLILAIVFVARDHIATGIIFLVVSMIITASQLVLRLRSKNLKAIIIGLQIVIVGALVWVLLQPGIIS